jgi:hypothetical protein
MKLARALYLIIAVILSAVVVSVSIARCVDDRIAVEVPLEGSTDDNVDADFMDDKECSPSFLIKLIEQASLNHSTGYRVSYLNHIKEIGIPPPKA